MKNTWWWVRYNAYMDVMGNAVVSADEWRVYLGLPRELRPFVAEQLWAVRQGFTESAIKKSGSKEPKS